MDKIDGFIRIHDGTRYLTLFGSEKYEAIYNRIRYLISQKSGITFIFSHHFANIKVDSYDSLPIEKRLTLHNLIIHIKTVLNKDEYHYYYKMFVEKCSYQLVKKQSQIFVRSIIMVKSGNSEIAKEKFYTAKRPIKSYFKIR